MSKSLSKIFFRAIKCLILFLFINSILIGKILPATALFALYIFINIKPVGGRSSSGKLSVLIGGRECIIMAAVCLVSEMILYVAIIFYDLVGASVWVLITNAVLCAVLLFVLVLNGFIRICATSKQAGIAVKILFISLWWFPVINLILLKKLCGSAIEEYEHEHKKAERNKKRKSEMVCKTKYPIVLVHGIFFRDWKLFNYWGRIPKELEENGAMLFYGGQQSSVSVSASAEELAASIERIIAETGSEKVNIIAHSKGGLDSRYAISCLGIDKHVASLTTINTPHYGCDYVGNLIEKIPKKFINSIDKKYETVFSILGDETPDFLAGLKGLTSEECRKLNEIMPDSPDVYYQSAASMMKSRFASPFPLNLGYSIIKPTEGDNDGLVATTSMKWGNFLGIVKEKGKKGISHGDMIDLTRKNIGGFDVCEYYVNLVKWLKEMGL